MEEKDVQGMSGDQVSGDYYNIFIQRSSSNIPPNKSSLKLEPSAASQTVSNNEREYWEWS